MPAEHHSYKRVPTGAYWYDRAKELEAELQASQEQADCGGVNCGKCQQCLTVNQWALQQALQAAQERVETLIEQYDHSDEICEGVCVPDRNRVVSDLRTIFPAKRTEPFNCPECGRKIGGPGNSLVMCCGYESADDAQA